MVGVGAQVEVGVGRVEDGLQQVVDAGPLLGGDVDEHRVAAVFLGDDPVLGQLGADLVGIGAVDVDLVDRDDDLHPGGLGVVDGFDRLRHDAVVGGHDEHGDVGDVGAARAHLRERLVAGGVDERDRPVLALVVEAYLVGADVLGDAPGLGLDHAGVADGVEQLGLAVVRRAP